MSHLPLPAWYDPRLIANPLFQPNQMLIMKQAYEIAAKHHVPSASKDTVRVCRFHVDELGDFNSPLTTVDPYTGQVTRYIPAFFKGSIEVPEWWSQGINQLVWHDDLDPSAFLGISSGRLSVAGSWNDTRRLVEWDMEHAHRITLHIYIIDSHGLTNRFDMHFWKAIGNNPHVAEGQHPYPFMDGPTQPFPKITPETCYHPKHNPEGIWEGSARSTEMVDENWRYINKVKVAYLWSMHANHYTMGQCPDPVVMASGMHHAFLRGGLEAEPAIYPKGLSWRTEFFGGFGPEFRIVDEKRAMSNISILQLLISGIKPLDIAPFDQVVGSGQALSHCFLRTLQQGVRDLKEEEAGDLAERIVCLTDTSSNIIGFDEETEQALEVLKKDGIRMETTRTFDLAA